MLEQAKYFSNDTIAAIASGVGGALLVLRVSGPKCAAICEQILLARKNPKDHPREVVLCDVVGFDGKKIDQATAVFYKSPASYTGEDALELTLHGSAFIASKVLIELHALGVRSALPGEFSFRAVRSGKLTLQQAEAVADLIACSNDRALEHSLERLDGSSRALLQELGEKLRSVTSLGELGIDFSDQDVQELGMDRLKKDLSEILPRLRIFAESYERGRRIHEGVRVAFVGLPNAGKSSLFNALLGEDRSIVSEIAGTTRDVIRETMTLSGKTGAHLPTSVTFRLEDTAGVRSTSDRIEKEGIERTFRAARSADLVVWMVDPTSEDAADWMGLWEDVEFSPDKTLGIWTKSDLDSHRKRDQLKCREPFSRVSRWVSTSTVTGLGLKETAECLVEMSQEFVRREPGETLLTRREQQEALFLAIGDIERAIQAPSLDLFSADLRQALHHLGSLIGETVPDDILGRIFSGFCIGK